jgi:hypothetical protein
VGGWPPTLCRAGDDDDGHPTPSGGTSRQLTTFKLFVFVNSFNVVVVLKCRSGGGEVSGGGTLYMKWGAGLFGPRRERIARAGE